MSKKRDLRKRRAGAASRQVQGVSSSIMKKATIPLVAIVVLMVIAVFFTRVLSPDAPAVDATPTPLTTQEEERVVVAPDDPEMETVSTDAAQPVAIYYFWGEGCPYCAEQELFWEQLMQDHGEKIALHSFEVWRNPDNVPYFQRMAHAYGARAEGVPMTFIGGEYWVGFARYMGEEMEQKVRYCIQQGCEDPGARLQ